MTIFRKFGLDRSRLRLLNAQTFALEQLVCIHSVNIDLRWAMVELALRSFTAMCALAQRQLALLTRRNLHHEKKSCAHGVTCC